MPDETSQPAPLIPHDPSGRPTSLAHSAEQLAAAGRAADAAAAKHLFDDYRARKAANTRRAHDADLGLFSDYLWAAGIGRDPVALASDPTSWSGMTHGLVAGFVAWLLQQGAAIGSINRALSTIRVYAELASRAGALDPSALILIHGVHGYSVTEGKRLDAQREETRRGAKKETHTLITLEQARALKRDHPSTPQGRRDALLMCLFVDHGFRVGEVAILAVTAINLQRGEITVYRPKVDLTQTHRLSADALRAATVYLTHDAPAAGLLWRGSKRNGELSATALKERAIHARVELLGERLGIVGLSPHDLRHYWATNAARNGTPIDVLQWAGGWSSYAMPGRYITGAQIANEGVRLEE
jgi:integrase